MPLWSGVVRILRRRFVLGIIFGLSVIYCGFSLFQPDRKGAALGIDYYDSDANTVFHRDADDVNEEEDPNDSYKSPEKVLAWQLDSSNNEEHGNVMDEEANESNRSEVLAKPCRNSIQGKILLVDDRGYVCPRQEILPSGCCSSTTSSNEEKNPVKKSRYSCDTCNPQGCCATYEYCVSCCLHPAKHIKLKKKSEAEAVRKDSLKARRGEDIFRLRLRNLDRFQICLAACRTSSASVRHENTYKDPHKHCYSLNHLAGSPQRSRRDVFSINNNSDGPAAVVALSSVMKSFADLPTSSCPVNSCGIVSLVN